MPEFWKHQVSDITKRMSSELKQNIQKETLEWLRDSPESYILTFDLKTTEGESFYTFNFSRSIVHIKTCSNVWIAWNIAMAEEWPELIAMPMEIIGTNSMEEDFIMPNEIRSEGSKSSTNKTQYDKLFTRYEIIKRINQ